MADEQPSLSIDTDWKKQAQEEKRRLAEEAQKKAAASAAAATTAPVPSIGGPAAAPPPMALGGAPAAAPRTAGRGRRELPPVSFSTLVQSILTQVLFYLGDLSPQGGEPMLNLDMARHQIDTLGMLEEKTKNNLSPDEQRMLDTALYEARSRFVGVASQYI